MHFSAFLKFFYMVPDKLYYFVFKLIATSGPEKAVQVLVLCFQSFSDQTAQNRSRIGTVPWDVDDF